MVRRRPSGAYGGVLTGYDINLASFASPFSTAT